MVVADARRNDRSIAQSVRGLRAEGHPVSRHGVLRYAGEAVKRGRGGRLEPTDSDRLYRRVLLPSADGNVWVDVRSSRKATLAGEYRNAVKAFLGGRDPAGERVRRYAGKRVGGLSLVTDLDVLEELARRQRLEELQEEGS